MKVKINYYFFKNRLNFRLIQFAIFKCKTSNINQRYIKPKSQKFKLMIHKLRSEKNGYQFIFIEFQHLYVVSLHEYNFSEMSPPLAVYDETTESMGYQSFSTQTRLNSMNN